MFNFCITCIMDIMLFIQSPHEIRVIIDAYLLFLCKYSSSNVNILHSLIVSNEIFNEYKAELILSVLKAFRSIFVDFPFVVLLQIFAREDSFNTTYHSLSTYCIIRIDNVFAGNRNQTIFVFK